MTPPEVCAPHGKIQTCRLPTKRKQSRPRCRRKHGVSSPRKRGSIFQRPRFAASWVPACAGTTAFKRRCYCARPGHEGVLAGDQRQAQSRSTQKNTREDVMPNDSDGRSAPRDVSRRHLLEQVGLAGAAAAVSAAVPAAAVAQGAAGATPGAVPKPEVTAPSPAPPAASPTMPRLEVLETLTAAEADTLEAMVARLIPSDENGPGASEARAAHYIDRALTGPLRGARASYAANLAALDAYAQASKGAVFANLAAAEQDAVLTDMEKNVATGFTPNAAAFFALVRTHTIQ